MDLTNLKIRNHRPSPGNWKGGGHNQLSLIILTSDKIAIFYQHGHQGNYVSV